MRLRTISSRLAERVASRMNQSNLEANEVTSNNRPSPLEAEFLRRAIARRYAQRNNPRRRRRSTLDNGPDNDIHEVARSRNFSDLLDNPLGPTTRAAHRNVRPRLMELVDLTASDTESPIFSRLTRAPSSSSSSSEASIPSSLSLVTSEDSSESEDVIHLPTSPPPLSSSSSSSSSSDHEE